MRILRRLFYFLLILVLIGWIAAWFVGRWIIQTRIAPELTQIDGGDLDYAAEGYRVGGFPFAYTLQPQNAAISSGGMTLARPSAQTRTRVSLPGTALGYLTGGPIGARVNLAGSHEFIGGWRLDVGQGSSKTTLHQLSGLSRGANWAFEGVDMDFQNLSLSQNDETWMDIGAVRLTLHPLNGEDQVGLGYAFRLDVRDIVAPEGTFQTLPATIEGLSLSGQFRPELNSGLLALVQDLQTARRAALVRHPEALGQILASRPGVQIDQGSLQWGMPGLILAGICCLFLLFAMQRLRYRWI